MECVRPFQHRLAVFGKLGLHSKHTTVVASSLLYYAAPLALDGRETVALWVQWRPSLLPITSGFNLPICLFWLALPPQASSRTSQLSITPGSLAMVHLTTWNMYSTVQYHWLQLNPSFEGARFDALRRLTEMSRRTEDHFLGLVLACASSSMVSAGLMLVVDRALC